jgi:peptide deformylase
MFEDLTIIHYPDPRLKLVGKPVETFDASLKELTARMFDLMRKHRGVGLAAPQVGVNLRLFVTNHTGKLEDDRVYVNPELFDLTGAESDEEGCLSLPEINASIDRAITLRIVAKDVEGNPIDQTETGYVARIWQHEFDHLNGILLLDRMGPVAKMTHRKTIRALEDTWKEAHPAPPAKPAKKPLLRRRRSS